ncbi:ATP phosphoribosyltransferase [Streptomyces hoynatensis]|uniref:ATP phosphoribosyltransferase n=1 Tax=Streptomyces hoynatensis TaxID=1141874 RepID=A0A3A9ZBK0_9ACTN|nr:ATP phosphoribosyltransferase [Streptomyces hoynatensis]RKN44746.1 ATP phosphoribosyltransferase [Streptomyces hoynatensis]
MLRIAVPNKGALSEPAAAMLHEAGYRQRKDRRELVLIDQDNQVEFFYLRPRDIAVYVGSGRLDIGITGRDLLLDSGADAEEILRLGFAASTLRYATRPGGVRDVREFGGLTIATSFAGVVSAHLEEHGVDASVVHLDGAVETAIQLGVAEVIADVVETGTTLRNAGLEIIGAPILESEAVVIRRTGARGEEAGAEAKVRQFLRRLQGVLVARRYVMMDYDIRAELVEKAVALTPGLESPTVSPLHDRGWAAVRSMVPVQDAQRVMDELYELGARAILTTGIHAARL